MAQTHEVIVLQAISGGVDVDVQKAWLDFEVDAENSLRIKMPEDYLGGLKVAIQKLQTASSDNRREKGLPTLQTAYVAKVKDIEFGQDDTQKVAVLRTRFETGESQDTVLDVPMIRETIRYLEQVLDQFEHSNEQAH